MSTKHIQAAEFRRLAALQPKDSDIEVALTNAAMQWEIDAKRFEDSAKLQEIGKSAFESIAEMVAALECDYDRLEELRDACNGLERECKDSQASGADDEPGTLERALQALKDWDEENAEELEELAAAAGDCKSREDAERRIQEDPLSLEVRSEWHALGDADGVENTEFVILLSTGGPATRIRGELQNGAPHRAWLETQDWFLPWTQIYGDSETLLTYCSCFYFGES